MTSTGKGSSDSTASPSDTQRAYFKQPDGTYKTISGYPFDGAKKAEHERLEQQHWGVYQAMCERLVHAPLSRPRRILDIGCGTGATTVILAKQFPDAQVIGIDPLPVPPIHEKPSNVTYLVAKFEDLLEQKHPDVQAGSFDYVYSRWMVCCVDDWPVYLRRCASVLKPGGWLELHEGENWCYYSADSPDKRIDDQWRWNKFAIAATTRRGFEVDVGSRLSRYVSKYARLENVYQEHNPLPCTPWPEKPETEAWTQYRQIEGSAAAKNMLKNFLKIEGKATDAEIQELQEEAERTELKLPVKGVHWRFYAVWGQKPG